MNRTHVLIGFILFVAILSMLVNVMSVRGKSPFQKSLTVWVFDVGQGDAIFIDGPEKQMLIDGGPDASVLEKLSEVMLPWDDTIDIVAVTHPHADHLTGIVSVLDRYRVGEVFESGQGYGSPEFFEFEKEAPRKRSIKASDVIDLGGGVSLTALWPDRPYEGSVLDDPNDGSTVFLLRYGETSMLLTGDAGAKEEMNWQLGHMDILKVGHHGSRTSTSEKLLQQITPNVGIISVGEGNDYGLPDEDVLERLSNLGAMIYRTDIHKDVRITSTGGEPEIKLFDI